MSIAENIARVRANIAAAAKEAGRDVSEITLVGASKMNDADACRQAIAAGIDVLGENREQEMTKKLAEHAYDGAPLHFIGHLQRNKVKNVVGKVAMIESVGSLELLSAIDKQAEKLGIVQDILLEVNIGGEEAKSGFAPESLEQAAEEAKKYGEVRIAASSREDGYTFIPRQFDWNPDAAYAYITTNNTIYGTRYTFVPDTGAVPLVADMSSMILSKPVDVTKYGCIYFGVQKNVAPAGMAIAIVRDDLLGHAADTVPTMMNYTTLLAKDSMYNTPPCWCIYMTGLVLKYLENDIGGLANMQKINEAKAKVLYDYLDGQDFFQNPVEHRYRSTMNVTFTSPDPDMDKKFCAEAAEAGFVNLKGHRLVGGMRASIYNAMPPEGIDKLVDFMEKFRKENA